MRYFFALALVLAGCTTAPIAAPGTNLGMACDSYAATLEQVTVMRAAGELSEESIARVDAANEQVGDICSSTSWFLPVTSGNTVLSATAVLQTIRSQ